jgi:hypothetical protein
MKISALGILASFAATTPLAAQVRLETGGGQAQLDQLPNSSVTAFGGSVDALLGRTSFAVAGTANDHMGLGTAGTMRAGLLYHFTPGGWTILVGPVSQVARDIGLPWAGTLAAEVRAERRFGPLLAHAGWDEGVARVGSQRSIWRRPSFGADFHVGGASFSASWEGTVVQDSIVRANVFFVAEPTQNDTFYQSRVRDIHDVAVRFAWESGMLSLNGRVGRRFGVGVAPQDWYEGHAALHLTQLVSLTVRAGRLASDALLGLRGGQFTTLGLQVDFLQRTPEREHHGNTPLAEVVRESPGTVHLYFMLPMSTRRATIASDLTEWQGVELLRTDDGRWEVVLAANAGVHRLNIKADNGSWQAPPGLPVADDGFGAKVGLLILEK